MPSILCLFFIFFIFVIIIIFRSLRMKRLDSLCYVFFCVFSFAHQRHNVTWMDNSGHQKRTYPTVLTTKCLYSGTTLWIKQPVWQSATGGEGGQKIKCLVHRFSLVYHISVCFCFGFFIVLNVWFIYFFVYFNSFNYYGTFFLFFYKI